MAAGHCRGVGLVWDLVLGYRQLLGDSLFVCIPRVGTDLGPVDRVGRRERGRSWTLGARDPKQGESHPGLLSSRRRSRKPDSRLGRLSRRCHQTAHVAGCLSAGRGHICVLRVHLLLVHHPPHRQVNGLAQKQVHPRRLVRVSNLVGLPRDFTTERTESAEKFS